MSFWGATVITSLASALPIVGESVVSWLWGGFSVDNATLNRFFSLHYLLPFGIAALSATHLAALHQHGSNNPIGVAGDKLMLYPYYFVKDFVGWLLFGLLLCGLVVYSPNVLGHPDNYISANPRVRGKKKYREDCPLSSASAALDFCSHGAVSLCAIAKVRGAASASNNVNTSAYCSRVVLCVW